MFSKLIKALLGAAGIIRKDLKFDSAHNAEFLKSLEPGTIILIHKMIPKKTTWNSFWNNFLSGGITGATNSAYNHSLLYVGKTAGAMIRQKIPELLNNRKIPADSQYNEIVEAQGGGVQVDNLQKNLGDDIQMVAYYRPISQSELITILQRIYSNVGKNYGFLDFLSELFPDPSAVNLGDDNGFICSALTTDAWLPIEQVCKKNINPHKATPGDQNDYLEPNLKWQQTRYNW